MMKSEDLEKLIRRVVREEVGDLLKKPARSILDDWRHEGPDEPWQDQLLLQDALAVLRVDGDDPEAWLGWDDCEAELDRAEAAGELPD